MNIRNIDKFRDELYKAVKSCVWCDGEPRSLKAVIKTEYEDEFCDILEDNIPEYAMVNGELEAVALPYPLKLGETGYYLTVDPEAWVRVYKDLGTHFKGVDFMSPRYEVNKMSFAMEVVRTIDRALKAHSEEV